MKIVTGAPVAAALVWSEADAAQAGQNAQQARAAATKTGAAFKPKFFNAHEYATVSILVDLILPKDDRSGSATDAGVPEFMDFMMIDQPQRQVAMRGGLALIDRLGEDRYQKRFVALTDAQRRAILDEIAYTSNRDPGLRHHIAFFSSFRDLTASGFWTTKMGIEDLQYQGNVFVDEWNGCPKAALDKLDVKY